MSAPAEVAALRAEVERLQAEVERLRPDAERYRWVRDNHVTNEASAEIVFALPGRVWVDAIDAAMREEGKP